MLTLVPWPPSLLTFRPTCYTLINYGSCDVVMERCSPVIAHAPWHDLKQPLLFWEQSKMWTDASTFWCIYSCPSFVDTSVHILSCSQNSNGCFKSRHGACRHEWRATVCVNGRSLTLRPSCHGGKAVSDWPTSGQAAFLHQLWLLLWRSGLGR